MNIINIYNKKMLKNRTEKDLRTISKIVRDSVIGKIIFKNNNAAIYKDIINKAINNSKDLLYYEYYIGNCRYCEEFDKTNNRICNKILIINFNKKNNQEYFTIKVSL